MKFGGLSIVWTCRMDEQLLLEVREGYITPSGNIAVAEEKEPLEQNLTRIIRFVMTPDNPVCSDEIPAPLDEIQL